MSWLHCKKMSDLEMELSLGKMALKALRQKYTKTQKSGIHKKWKSYLVEAVS